MLRFYFQQIVVFYAGFSSVSKRIEMASLTISSDEGLISALRPHKYDYKYDYIYEASYEDCRTVFRIYEGFFFGGGGMINLY